MFQSKGIVYTFYLTPRCNLDCAYCYEDKSDLPEDMDSSEIDYYLHDIQFRDMVPNAIFLFGGEPTLRWDLIEYFQNSVCHIYPNLQKSKRVLFTNGLLLTNDRLAQISLWVMDLFISFDGFEKSSELRYAKSNLQYLEKIKRLFSNVHKYGINTTIVFTIGKHNIKSIFNDIVFLHKEYNLNYFKVNTIHRADLSANINYIIKYRNKAIHWARERKLSLMWDHPAVFGSQYDNYFISSRTIRYLPAFKKAHWEKTKW